MERCGNGELSEPVAELALRQIRVIVLQLTRGQYECHDGDDGNKQEVIVSLIDTSFNAWRRNEGGSYRETLGVAHDD